jgi:16S rRNA (cytidine(1402)-2'-O)-methyltransferase
MPLAVCATPIGNLEDVTLRVLTELREADVVLCEDTRHTRTLLARHGIDARVLSYHEHNEAVRTAELLPRLEAGERIALVSDAGMPGVSDPGARIVRAALDAGLPVTVLPGASAVETAHPGSSASGTSSSASFRAARRTGTRSPACHGRPLRSSRRGGCLRRCGRWRTSIPSARSRSAAS